MSTTTNIKFNINIVINTKYVFSLFFVIKDPILCFRKVYKTQAILQSLARSTSTQINVNEFHVVR